MPGWMNVSVIVKSVRGAFDFGDSLSASAAIAERDASILLDEINKILVNTNGTLDQFKGVLPGDEYASFLAQHKVLHLRMQTQQHDYRDFDPQLAQQGRTPTGACETKEVAQGRALDLLSAVEEYSKKVVHASHKAGVLSAPAFPDEEPQPTEPQPTPVVEASPAPTPSAPTHTPTERLPLIQFSSATKLGRPSFVQSNLGLMKRMHDSGIISFLSMNGNVDRAIFQSKDLQFAVTHTLIEDDNSSNPPAPSTKRMYRRTIIMRYGDEVLEIPDPEPREVDDSQINLDATALFVIQEATQKWVGEILARDID